MHVVIVSLLRNAELEALLAGSDQSGRKVLEGRKLTETVLTHTHTPSPKVPLQFCVLPSWFGDGAILGWSLQGRAPAGFISFPEICELAEGIKLQRWNFLICNQVPKVVGGYQTSFSSDQVFCSGPVGCWGGGWGEEGHCLGFFIVGLMPLNESRSNHVCSAGKTAV